VKTELFPHHASRRPPSLVATKLVSNAYLKLSNVSLRLSGPTLQMGLTLSQTKDFGRRQ
jgi:hypothetical protein